MQTYQLSLTPSQAAYLQTLLPHSHSFQIFTIESKRPRTLKKIDESFTADFDIPNQKKQTAGSKCNVSNSMKSIPQVGGQLVQDDIASTPVKPNLAVSKRQKRQTQQKNQKFNEKSALALLGKLRTHKSSWPFRNPVNPQAQGVPNYLEIIKEPMDLKTVQRNIKSHLYKTFQDFETDIIKIISNSYTFNPPDTIYHGLTNQFQAFYEDLRKQLADKPQCFASPRKERQKIEGEQYQQEEGQNNKIEATPKKKIQKKQSKPDIKNGIQLVVQEAAVSEVNQSSKKLKVSGIELSFQKRERLFNKIQKLSQQGIKKLVKMWGVAMEQNWSELQLDFGELSQQKFRKVQLFLLQS